MACVVPIQAVLRVNFGVLADVFDIRCGFRCGGWSDHVWSTDGRGESAADGRIQPVAGEPAINADIRCLGGHEEGGDGELGECVDVFGTFFLRPVGWDSAAFLIR